MLRLAVTQQEAELINTIRELGFGELFGVEVDVNDDQMLVYAVSRNEHDLLALVRGGTQKIDVLTVHQGEPVLAEVDFTNRGFRCRKKIKFPTVQTEG